MAVSEDLFDLIKSLGRSEKRYLKMAGSIMGGEKIYLEIFELIDKQTVYNEKEIIKSLEKKKKVSQFPVYKNYLYNWILKTLFHYESQRYVYNELKQQLVEIRFLTEKGLFGQAKKKVKKAKRIAEKYEYHTIVLEVIDLEIALMYELRKMDKIQTLLTEYESVIQSLTNLKHYERLCNEALFIINENLHIRNETVESRVNKILNDELLQNSTTLLGFREKDACYLAKGICYRLLRLDDKSDQVRRERVELYRSNPHFMYEQPKAYLSARTNKILSTQEPWELEKLPGELNELRQIPDQLKLPKNHLLRTETLFFSYNVEFDLLLAKGDFKAGVRLSGLVEKAIADYGDLINESRRITFYYLIAYSHFGDNQLTRSLKWVNAGLEIRNSIRQDMQTLIRILNLLVHFELGNYTVLESHIRSTFYFLKKKGLLNEFEQVLLNFLRKLPREYADDKILNLFNELKEELETLSKSESIFLEYIAIVPWLESKITGKSFVEMIRKRNENHQ